MVYQDGFFLKGLIGHWAPCL